MQVMTMILAVALALWMQPVQGAPWSSPTSRWQQNLAAPAPSHIPVAGAAVRPEPATISHERLFIAVFDCSWKNASKGPSEPTTMASMHRQLIATHVEGRIRAGYELTDCARHNWFTADNGNAFVDAKLTRMSRQLGEQSERWLQQDPQAKIALLVMGGSWGALQAAEFSARVDAVGIRTVAGKVLVAPGKFSQAIALLDPVGKMPADFRLADSVVSGIQFSAMDEHRGAFKTLPIIEPGQSADRRFLGLQVPGSTSDVCGGYFRDGLAARTANLLIVFINKLSEVPLLTEQPEPADPRMNVIHHSQEEGT